ncbi:hypothetical protein ES708_22791 [subsurface metagenome]
MMEQPLDHPLGVKEINRFIPAVPGLVESGAGQQAAEHFRFIGQVIRPPNIYPPQLKEPDAALFMPPVCLQHRQQVSPQTGAKILLLGTHRPHHPQRLRLQGVWLGQELIHQIQAGQGIGNYLIKAVAGKVTPHLLLETDDRRRVLPGHLPTGHGHRNPVIADNTGYLLHQVLRQTDVAPPVGCDGFNLRSRFRLLAVKAQRNQRCFYLPKAEFNAQKALHLPRRKQDWLRLRLAGIGINYTFSGLAAGQLDNQPGSPPERRYRQLGADAPLKAHPGFARDTQSVTGLIDARRIKISRFQHDGGGPPGHLAVSPTHHPGDGHRPLSVGNNQHIRGKGPLRPVQGDQDLTLFRPPHDNLPAPDPVIVKGV